MVRTNDYTKNISDFLFSPAINTPPKEEKKKSYKLSEEKSQKEKHQRNKMEVRKSLSDVKRLHDDIHSEKKVRILILYNKQRREVLRKEVNDLKDQMSTIYSYASKSVIA